MDPDRDVVLQRRERLIQLLTEAYQERDFDAFEPMVRPDVVLTLSGSSWLAGIYHGYEPFSSYLLGLRQVLRWEGDPIRFSHHGDRVICRQAMVVSGPRHDVDVVMIVTVDFHEDGRIDAIYAQPEDQGLFDHVANSILEDSRAF